MLLGEELNTPISDKSLFIQRKGQPKLAQRMRVA